MRLKCKSASKIRKRDADPKYNYFTQTVGCSKVRVPLASSNPIPVRGTSLSEAKGKLILFIF